MYTLSPSKNIKGSNYGEFLKDKNLLLCTRLYKYAPNLESLLTQQYVWEAALIYVGWFFFQAILYMLPVGRVVEGQPLRTGGKLKYRCNGK
jgi:hypothetical protein